MSKKIAPAVIEDTDDAWDERQLGASAEFVETLSPEELAADISLVNESLGLQPISIRLEKDLIEAFKHLATINGIGYQTLMRQALKRFAVCEMKLVLRDLAAQRQQQEAQKQETQRKVA